MWQKVESLIHISGAIQVIEVVQEIIEGAYEYRASDIHIDPGASEIRVRYRIDGELRLVGFLPLVIHPEVISRIKIISGLRTDEHAVPQDGRFKVRTKDTWIDIRVSIIPTYFGENAVLRILGTRHAGGSLEELGFSALDIIKLRRIIKKPHGMIIVTGPTGSGKTTTLYGLVNVISEKETSVVTIEDPIEFSLPHIRQIQVNTRIGLTFAQGLRSVLRQDPNVIMVGEIRDQETAHVAVNSSLTGHLLLSTMHTNDAVSSVVRLIDMNIDHYLVSSALSCAIAQRLVRKICDKCKEVRNATVAEKELVLKHIDVKKKISVYFGKGCSVCSGTGYYGRSVIYEILETNDSFKDLIYSKVPQQRLTESAVQYGMVPLVRCGFMKVLEGVTTLEEVVRVIYE